jgi:hypothetical protein
VPARVVVAVVGGWVVGADVVVATGGGSVVVGAVLVVTVVDLEDEVVWVGSGAASCSFDAVHETAITVTSAIRDIERVNRRLERTTISHHFPDFSAGITPQT